MAARHRATSSLHRLVPQHRGRRWTVPREGLARWARGVLVLYVEPSTEFQIQKMSAQSRNIVLRCRRRMQDFSVSDSDRHRVGFTSPRSQHGSFHIFADRKYFETVISIVRSRIRQGFRHTECSEKSPRRNPRNRHMVIENESDFLAG